MKPILPFIFLLVLGACGSKMPTLETKTISVAEEKVETPFIHPETPPPLTVPEMKIQVVTAAVAETRLRDGTYEVIWGFNENDYLDLAQFLEQLSGRLDELWAIIRFYQEAPRLNPEVDEPDP